MKKIFFAVAIAAAVFGGNVKTEAAFNPGPHIIVPNVTVADERVETKLYFLQKLFPTAPTAFLEYVLELCNNNLFDAITFIKNVIG